jgi:hypothetical protein
MNRSMPVSEEIRQMPDMSTDWPQLQLVGNITVVYAERDSSRILKVFSKRQLSTLVQQREERSGMLCLYDISEEEEKILHGC